MEFSNLPQGENEAVFNLYGVRFHMLDENPPYGLVAPAERVNSIWFNILVPDIKETYQKAMDAGCTEIQGVTELPDYGVTNAVFADPFGYIWMLHQIHRLVSHEERLKLWEEEKAKQEQ